MSQLLQGLQLCMEYNIDAVDIKSDSMILVNVLKGDHIPFSCMLIIRKISTLLQYFQATTSHFYREYNKARDFLANYGNDHRMLQEVQLPLPPKLKSLICSDIYSLP